jgi:diguanylate cyclase (GGDEF)-like protein/PAS domain S-box-containing protein
VFSLHDSDICRSILESLPTGVCVVDMQKKILLWSDGAERITGHLRHEVIGRSCIAEPLLHCNQPGCEFCSADCPLARAIKTAHAAESNSVLHHKSGYEVPVRVRAVPVRSQNGSIVGAVEMFEDLQPSVIAAHSSSVQLPEFMDPVTGTASRATAERYLHRAFVTYRELHIPFGVLLIRVEKLTSFRANLGTEAGSSFLRVVARTLEGSFSIADYIGRWTDDQFLVVLSGCQQETLPSLREQVRRTLAGEGIEWWGERHSLPVSIGEACVQPDDTPELLLGRAHKSLHAASVWLTGTAALGPDSAGS